MGKMGDASTTLPGASVVDKWDAADVALLEELGPDPDVTWKQVGARLGRTAEACRSKWYRMR